MNFEVEILNFDVVFFPPEDGRPARLTWNGEERPEIVVHKNFAVITLSLSTSGLSHDHAIWVSNPVDWVDEETLRSSETPPEMTIRREHEQLATILDFNARSGTEIKSRYFIVSIQFKDKVFSFDPTIINVKPGSPRIGRG